MKNVYMVSIVKNIPLRQGMIWYDSVLSETLLIPVSVPAC